METKILVFIVIGLVVGSGLGYMGDIVVTEPKINSLNQKITNLETNVTSARENMFIKKFICKDFPFIRISIILYLSSFEGSKK